MDKIKISAVSYLNTKPFIYGLQNSSLVNRIDLSLDTPSDCAIKLISGKADIGLVPVVVIPEIKTAEIISHFCIGAEGAVGSVLLVSDVPLNEIESILLDYQSMTSVALIKILAKNHWNINPVFINAEPGYERKIADRIAGVIIGDRALQQKKNYAYVYDLALAWFEYTGLPFVFACWVSNKKIPDDFLQQFESALASAVSQLDHFILMNPAILNLYSDASFYLKNQIRYSFDEPQKKGLALFLSML
jgi:chorismate dehydratase